MKRQERYTLPFVYILYTKSLAHSIFFGQHTQNIDLRTVLLFCFHHLFISPSLFSTLSTERNRQNWWKQSRGTVQSIALTPETESERERKGQSCDSRTCSNQQVDCIYVHLLILYVCVCEREGENRCCESFAGLGFCNGLWPQIMAKSTLLCTVCTYMSTLWTFTLDYTDCYWQRHQAWEIDCR